MKQNEQIQQLVQIESEDSNEVDEGTNTRLQEENEEVQGNNQGREENKNDKGGTEIEDLLFREFEELFGEQVLIVTESAQLSLLGQTFRPIFCGPIVEVEHGHITIYPATIKILNAPFFQFPTPLSIPLEKIAHFTPNFDCKARIPLI